MYKKLSQIRIAVMLVIAVIILAACGQETVRSNPSPYVPPTAPPTPSNFDEVPDAATAAAITRNAPSFSARPGGAVAATPTATPALAVLPDNPENREVDSAPDKVDPTTLAKLLGSPGPGS